MQLLLNIDVPDLKRAHAFYSKAFGLTVCRSLGSEILELSGSAVPVFLLLKAEGSTPFEGAVAPRRINAIGALSILMWWFRTWTRRSSRFRMQALCRSNRSARKHGASWPFSRTPSGMVSV